MNVPDAAFKNLKRNIARSWLLLSIVAVVSCVLFTAALLLQSVNNALRQGADRLGTDIVVLPDNAAKDYEALLLSGEPSRFLMDKTVLDRVRKIRGVQKATSQLFIKTASRSCCFSLDALLVAVDPIADFTVRPRLQKNLHRELGSNEMISGSAMSVVIGDAIPFFNTTFQVAGIMKPTGMDFFDRAAVLSMESAYGMIEKSTAEALRKTELGRGRISAVLARVGEGSAPGRVAINIEQNVPGVRALVSDAVISTMKKRLSGLVLAVVTAGGILWLIVLVIMASVFYRVIHEGRREIGLLRDMGANRFRFLSMMAGKASLLSAGGWTAGIVLSFGLQMNFKDLMLRHLKLPYLLPSAPELAVLISGAIGFSLVTGVLSAALPSLLIMKTEPRSWGTATNTVDP